MIGRAEIGDYEDEAAEHFDGVALPNAHFVCHLRQPILGILIITKLNFSFPYEYNSIQVD